MRAERFAIFFAETLQKKRKAQKHISKVIARTSAASVEASLGERMV
jgi:hypothetical protein